MGYDTTGAGGVIYVCPHTGESFMGSTLASAKAMALSCSPNCEGAQTPATLSTLTGEQSSQVGSQVWMNANPTGETINLTTAQKMALCDNGSAVYAAGWLGTYVSSMPQSMVTANPDLGIIQSYPINGNTAELWRAVPQLMPPTYAQNNVTFATASNSPGSTNEPAYVRSANVLSSGTVLNDQSTAGVGSGGSGAVSTAANAIKSLPIALIVIIGAGLLLLFMMGKGLSGKVTG